MAPRAAPLDDIPDCGLGCHLVTHSFYERKNRYRTTVVEITKFTERLLTRIVKTLLF